MRILRPLPRAGRLDACLCTLEDRLELSETRRRTDRPRLHKMLTVDPTENLSAAAGGGFTVTAAINAWTDESGFYDPQDPINPETSGFTQVVWKDTKELGCAFVDCPAGTILPADYGVRTFPPAVVC